MTGGWLDVAGRVEIGARAQVDLAGGRLAAHQAVVLGAPEARAAPACFASSAARWKRRV